MQTPLLGFLTKSGSGLPHSKTWRRVGGPMKRAMRLVNLDVAFPLTPALSPRERENTSSALLKFEGSRLQMPLVKSGSGLPHSKTWRTIGGPMKRPVRLENLDVSFPLTPALSLGEREKRLALHEAFTPSSISALCADLALTRRFINN